jgi:hypothetical protein
MLTSFPPSSFASIHAGGGAWRSSVVYSMKVELLAMIAAYSFSLASELAGAGAGAGAGEEDADCLSYCSF